MKIKKICFTGCCVIAFFSISFADYIKLRSGDAAKIKVDDTTGCFVKYSKGESEVGLKKTLIKYLVMNNDTIDFSQYICTDSSAAGANVQTPKLQKNDKIINAISGLPYSTLQSIKEYSFFLVEKPVLTNIEDIDYNTIFEDSRQFFAKNHLELQNMSKDTLNSILASGKRDNAIIIVPTNVDISLKYKTEYKTGMISTIGPNGYTGSYPSNRIVDSTYKKYTELTATIACVDLKSMAIVFRDIYRKKKDNTKIPQFTDADARTNMNELNNTLVSRLYNEALKAIVKQLIKQ